MNQFTFAKNYKENHAYRQSFNDLATKIFGINFEPWFQQGFWNSRYICYSFLDGNKVISNVSVNELDAIINGEVKKAIQIGTVMTDPAYQKRGLASRLMNKVIEEYEEKTDLFFLFCAQENFEFYKKFKFHPQKEFTFTLPVTPLSEKKSIEKLNLQQHQEFLLTYYEKKKSSPTFDIENGEHVLGFYCVLGYEKYLYYIKELDTVVLLHPVKEKLHVYGIFTERELLFSHIQPYICTEQTTEVIFHFTPNFKDITPVTKELHTVDDVFHVRSTTINSFPHFKFPVIAHA